MGQSYQLNLQGFQAMNKNKLAIALFIAYNLAILYFLMLFIARIHKLYNEGNIISISLFILTTLGIIFIGGILILVKVKIKKR